MKFALVGDHPDGLDVTRAMAAHGRHELLAYSGPAFGLEVLQRDGLTPKRVVDLEEVLADPAVVVVIVAASIASRGAMLRRAVQSERHVLCVHPADPKPDLAFEVSMMQTDTGCVILPLLPEAFHPGMARFAQLARSRPGVLEVRRTTREEFWLESHGDAPRPGLPGWDVLRRLGGEIAEVFALSTATEPAPGQPVHVCGQFTDGRLFHSTFQANQPENYWRIAMAGPRPLSLVFPDGWPGPATLTHEDDTGALRTENWHALPPWMPLIEAFEKAVMFRPKKQPDQSPGKTDDRSWTSAAGRDSTAIIQAAETMVGAVKREQGPTLGWTDEIRALELDDSIRRSLHYRRSYTLDLQDASEDASFKGTMTLVGCSLIWIILALLVAAIWLPWVGWLIVPALFAFLVLQFLRPGGTTKGPSSNT